LKQSNPIINGSLAETINDFFVSVSAHLPPFDSSVIYGIQPDLPAQYVIDPIHVEYRLTQININKSPGPDGLPNSLLRDLAPLLSQPLAAIFNAFLRQGYLPPIVLLWYPKPTSKPRFFAKTVRRRNLGFFRHN